MSRRLGLNVIKVVATLQLEDLKEAYEQDLRSQKIIQELRSKTNSKMSWWYHLYDGILYYEGNRIFIPNHRDLRYRIIKEFHDLASAGHMVVDKTYLSL